MRNGDELCVELVRLVRCHSGRMSSVVCCHGGLCAKLALPLATLCALRRTTAHRRRLAASAWRVISVPDAPHRTAAAAVLTGRDGSAPQRRLARSARTAAHSTVRNGACAARRPREQAGYRPRSAGRSTGTHDWYARWRTTTYTACTAPAMKNDRPAPAARACG